MDVKEPPRLGDYVQQDQETTADVFEVSGSVKWFDPAKGYGFILPDDDLPDVLLHVTCLRRGGFQTVHEGARVVCDVVRRPKGLQAVCISHMDDSTAIRPSQLPQRSRHSRKKMGKTGGEVVQPSPWVRFPHLWSRNARHLRAYGDASPFGLHRAPAGSDRARALRARTKRSHGSRTQARQGSGSISALTHALRENRSQVGHRLFA